MDQVELFNQQLLEVIGNAKLPSSVIGLCLNNILYQIEINKLQNLLKEKNTIVETTEQINTGNSNGQSAGGGGAVPTPITE